MKKLYILIVLAVFGFSAMAQSNSGFKTVGDETNIDQLRKEFRAKQANSKTPIGWFIPSWDLLDNYHMTYDYVSHYANVTFQDSSVKYESQGALTDNWMCGFGGVLEPYSIMFDSNLAAPLIAPGAGYTVDSIMILGWYQKVNSDVDTLRIEIVTGAPRQDPAFGGVQWTFGSDTYMASPPKVASTGNLYGAECVLSDPSKTVIKYALTNEDSTNNNGKFIIVPCSIPVPADEVIGVSVVFVPGSQYTAGDTLFSYNDVIVNPKLNSFRIGLYATDDPNANPHYFGDDLSFSHSLSHYIPTDLRYQLYSGTNAWRNDRMGSLISWGFDIGYHVDANIGVEDNVAANNSVNVYPNPTSGVLNIELSSADNAVISIFDIAGNMIISKEVNQMNSTIDMSDVANGMYIVKVVQNGSVSSQKLMLSK